jgi:hypothetical protein
VGSGEVSPELTGLYRRVMKRVHPDLAVDEQDRLRCEELTLQANLAYERRDEAALRAVLQPPQPPRFEVPEGAIEAIEALTALGKLGTAIRERREAEEAEEAEEERVERLWQKMEAESDRYVTAKLEIEDRYSVVNSVCKAVSTFFVLLFLGFIVVAITGGNQISEYQLSWVLGLLFGLPIVVLIFSRAGAKKRKQRALDWLEATTGGREGTQKTMN